MLELTEFTLVAQAFSAENKDSRASSTFGLARLVLDHSPFPSRAQARPKSISRIARTALATSSTKYLNQVFTLRSYASFFRPAYVRSKSGCYDKWLNAAVVGCPQPTTYSLRLWYRIGRQSTLAPAFRSIIRYILSGSSKLSSLGPGEHQFISCLGLRRISTTSLSSVFRELCTFVSTMFQYCSSQELFVNDSNGKELSGSLLEKCVLT